MQSDEATYCKGSHIIKVKDVSLMLGPRDGVRDNWTLGGGCVRPPRLSRKTWGKRWFMLEKVWS